jgi:hypothetical protein
MLTWFMLMTHVQLSCVMTDLAGRRLMIHLPVAPLRQDPTRTRANLFIFFFVLWYQARTHSHRNI